MKNSVKKGLLTVFGALTLVALAGCSNDKAVVKMKGGSISQTQYYNKMKTSSAGKSTLQSMIIEKALDNQYGDKVKQSKVTAQFNKIKKTYGSSLTSLLAQQSMTQADLKQNIKINLLSEAALKANKKITKAELNKQWKSYEPKVQVQHILVNTKAEAEAIIKQLNSGSNFSKLAKQKSTDNGSKANGGKISAFDSTDTRLDSTFKKAAFKLKTGEYTKTPVKTQYGYHIIRMIKNPGKGTLSEHKKTLEAQIYSNWLQDTTVMQKVLAKVLKKANVQIKDKDLQNVLSSYLGTSSSSSSSSSK